MDLSLLEQFGTELRTAREASGRSVDEIARQTRIHRRYIEAIEAGDGAALPPGPYVPAFLREFARAVGLKVPPELAITSSINHGLTTATVQSAPIVKNAQGNPFSAVGKAADETAKFAGNVAKTAVKTTGTVIKGVGDGINDTAGFLTSRSLREEAEMVRRERLGLSKFSDRESEAVPAEQPAEPLADIAEERSALDAATDAEASGNTSTFERLSETQGRKAKVVKAPMLPLEISSEDPIGGDATLKLGKTSRKFPVTNIVILLLLIAFSLVAYFAIGNMREKKRGDVEQSTELTNEQDLPTAAASTPDATPAAEQPKPVTAPAVANDSLQFTLRATDEVWVSIGSDNANPFRGEMKAGETKTFAAADRFTINLGNQKALEMTFNGTRLSNLPTIKNSGMVVRNLVLTKDRVSLDGAEVNTTNVVEPSAAPVVQKPTTTTKTTTTAAKPAVAVKTTTKSTSTTIAKKPATTATKSTTASKTPTTSGVKKPASTTAKKPVRKPVVKSPTLIPSVDPKPAAAD